MRTALVLLLLASTLPVNAAETTGEVYRCVADDGTVEYTDRPCGEQAERLDITFDATSAESLARQRAIQEQARAAREQAEADAAESAGEAEMARRNQEERRSKCAAARERLQTLNTMPRMGVRTDDGEPRRYTNEEMEAAIRQANEQIAEYCGGDPS